MTPNEYQELALRTAPTNSEPIDRRLISGAMSQLLHAQLGITTESGEFADAIKKYIIYDRELDLINLKEELGDLLWYISIACDALDTTMEHIMEDNIEKLKIRYPSNFTEELAKERLDKKSPSIEALDKEAKYSVESRFTDGLMS